MIVRCKATHYKKAIYHKNVLNLFDYYQIKYLKFGVDLENHIPYVVLLYFTMYI